MNKEAMRIAAFLCIGIMLFLMAGCFKKEEPTTTVPPTTIEAPERTPSSTALEDYYDFFKGHPGMAMILYAAEDASDALSDDALAGFACITVTTQDGYDFDAGAPKDAYDLVTQKYFGRTIQDYNTGVTYVDEATGNILSTGWGWYSSFYAILKEMKMDAAGRITAQFYCVEINDFEMMDRDDDFEYESLKPMLLSGDVSLFDPPSLIEFVFTEHTDENGLYLKFESITLIEREYTGTVIPYSA